MIRRPFLLAALGALLAPAPPAAAQSTADSLAVAAVLDDFHDAASKADGERYFGHFARDGVFLGTDASERWTVAQFQDYARPYFAAGRGWTYVPTVRRVVVGPDGRTAWFDELLDNAAFGTTRGSGVLVREDGRWKIGLYDLTIPVPNPLAGHLAGLIADEAAAEADGQAQEAVRSVLQAYYDALSARRMLAADVRVRGDLATAWVRYRARSGDPGDVAEWEGVDAVTLLRDGGVWRITSVAWAP